MAKSKATRDSTKWSSRTTCLRGSPTGLSVLVRLLFQTSFATVFAIVCTCTRVFHECTPRNQFGVPRYRAVTFHTSQPPPAVDSYYLNGPISNLSPFKLLFKSTSPIKIHRRRGLFPSSGNTSGSDPIVSIDRGLIGHWPFRVSFPSLQLRPENNHVAWSALIKRSQPVKIFREQSSSSFDSSCPQHWHTFLTVFPPKVSRLRTFSHGFFL